MSQGGLERQHAWQRESQCQVQGTKRIHSIQLQINSKSTSGISEVKIGLSPALRIVAIECYSSRWSNLNPLLAQVRHLGMALPKKVLRSPSTSPMMCERFIWISVALSVPRATLANVPSVDGSSYGSVQENFCSRC